MSKTQSVRVKRKWQEAEGIYSFELEDAQHGTLPPFSVGSHIDVHIPAGFVRQYSLSRPYDDRGTYEIAVLREPQSRGGSEALCSTIEPGAILEISEPRNHFALEVSEHAVLLAGGIGITPLICMAEHLAASKASFELHYCARTASKMAFRDRITTSGFATRAFFHFDDGDEAQKLNLKAVLGAPGAAKHLYICGPAGFLEYVRTSARDAAWSDSNVHFEYFSAPSDENEGAVGSFEVVVASSGRTITVAADESIVAALAREGIEIPLSCEQGVCGTCITRVLEGEPDHRDYFLSDDERAANDQILLCCSRARSARLVLDL